MFNVTWNEHNQHLSTTDELERLLDTLHLEFLRTEPTLVSVELSESGDTLTIGLGDERSVLNYINGSQDPPYFTSRGELEEDEAIAFHFGNQWSEFPLRNSILNAIAREAMRYFCNTGQLSPIIKWEEV